MRLAPSPATASAASSTPPWLLVGLGNPGERYAASPHNLGFQVVECLAARHNLPLTKKSLEARWGRGRLEGAAVILAQPSTYMNLSGRAVVQLLRYFQLSADRLVVIHDDLDVPAGRLKLSRGGGAGGHRGVLSIAEALNTADFLRVKIGIGRPPPFLSAEDFVLRPFARQDWEAVADLVERAARAVVTLISAGLAAAQQQFHRAGVQAE
jgi:peptidyl-tRNA hydrolase, PTH1 family